MIIMYDIGVGILEGVDLCISTLTQAWETCVSLTQTHSETKGGGIFKGDSPVAFWYTRELWTSGFSLSLP